MNNTNRLLSAAIFSLVAATSFSMAENTQVSVSLKPAVHAEMMEEKAWQIFHAIQSGDTATARTVLNEIVREPEALTSLRGKDILTHLCSALSATTNETEAVCLGSVLIQIGDLKLVDEMVLLANSEDVVKKTIAAHFLLEGSRNDQDVLLAYDVLAEVAQTIAQMSLTNIKPEKSTHIKNIARDTIKKFDRLRINAGFAPLRDALNAADVGAIPADEYRIKQLQLILPWWQVNRLDVYESFKVTK